MSLLAHVLRFSALLLFNDPSYSVFFLACNFWVFGGQHVSSPLVEILKDLSGVANGCRSG